MAGQVRPDYQKCSIACLLYPHKPDAAAGLPKWSGPCQFVTHAAQQMRRYSITSSARASSEGGMVSPIAFAAFTLLSNWNFVA